MSKLKICRICLRTEAKGYTFDRYQLKYYYEEVMALKVNERDGLPQWFCFECATMLHKFHKFKEKCYSGQKALRELLWRGAITYEVIYKVDRNDLLLKSPLDVITITKRVKTYTAKDDMDLTKSILENIESRFLPINFFNEDSIADRDDHHDPINYPVSNEKGSDDEKINIDEDRIINKINIAVGDAKIITDDESTSISEERKELDLNIERCSPTTVYVDVKKNIIQIKSEEIKEKRRSSDGDGLNKFQQWKRKNVLDAKYWKKISLTEHEAVQEFRARAEEKKYLVAAYKCTDCFKGFSKKEMLNRHIYLRHSESLGSYECRFCRMRFKWDCYLRKHMRQHFNKFKCLRCYLVCPLENSALLHEEYHNGVIRKCIHCDEEFRHLSTYYTHLRTHRSEYVCSLCGASFVSEAGLHQHKKRKHVTNDIDSPDDYEDVNTFCERCDIRFETRKAYEEHLFHSAMHAEGVENELRDEVSIPRKILGKKEQAKITKELRKRRTADDILTSANTKKRRKLRKKHRKPTTCHQCGRHFETQAACMKHHLAEHPRTSFFPPNERHICEICGASLAPGSVAVHQNMHTREKLHACDTCGRQFHSTVGLKRHLVTHTGEKPFACTLCHKRFTQSNSMKLHQRTFHLKQPYPKRNRRKRKNDPAEAAEAEESSSDEDSDSLPEPEIDSMPEPETGIEPVPNMEPSRMPEDDVHYLTLT